jgi:hypothetical protein
MLMIAKLSSELGCRDRLGQHHFLVVLVTTPSTRNPPNNPEQSNTKMSLFQRNLIRRAWRVPGASSYAFIKPRPHLRLLGTASGGVSGNAASTNINAFALALGSVVLGLGGYYVGTRSIRHHPVSESSGSPSKPIYGTQEDFARAIEELKTLFSEEIVTTAEDELKAHGFSPNTHFPGTVHTPSRQGTSFAHILSVSFV